MASTRQHMSEASKKQLCMHMQELMSRVKHSQAGDAYEKFEEISMMVKRSRLNYVDPQTASAVNAINSNQEKKQVRDTIAKFRDLLNEVSSILPLSCILTGQQQRD